MHNIHNLYITLRRVPVAKDTKTVISCKYVFTASRIRSERRVVVSSRDDGSCYVVVATYLLAVGFFLLPKGLLNIVQNRRLQWKSCRDDMLFLKCVSVFDCTLRLHNIISYTKRSLAQLFLSTANDTLTSVGRYLREKRIFFFILR